MTSRPLLPLLYLQCPAPTGVSFTPFSLVPSLLTPNPSIPQRLGLVGFSLILFPCPWAGKGVCGAKWGQECPSAVTPASPPSAPPEPGLRRFLGGWLGPAAAAAVLLCHARRRRRRRPELEGEEGRNLIDLSGSEGLEANTELPQNRPGAGRAPLPRGALPAGQMVSGAAQVVALGRERAGGLDGEAGKTGSHPSQTEGAQCPAERERPRP